MVGSLTSNPRRRVAALLAVLTLIAAGCSGSSDETASDAISAETETEAGAASDSADVVTESSDGAVLDAQVLALAIEASDELSYTFEQGQSVEVIFGGTALELAPDAAFVTGDIDGDDIRVNADIGSLMTAIFGALDAGAGQGLGIEGLEMDVWVVDNTAVIDLASFVDSFSGIDPVVAEDLALFADGPVAVDLDALADISDVDTDVAALVEQFGQGVQITDPSVVLDALRTVDVLEDAGSSTLDGVEVDVYVATVAMNDYLEALDLDVDDQLGGLGGFGTSADGPDAADVEATLESIRDLTVDLTIMLDDEGLVRRLESTVDLGAALAAVGEAGIADEANPLGALDLNQIEAVMQTWQNFDNYGEDLSITPPAAEDRTAEVAALLEN